jgi:ribosomal protein S18 acetylase RimI-like enzyme
VEQQACAIGRAAGDRSIALFSQATSSHPAQQRALLQFGFVVTSTYEEMELALREPPMQPDVVVGIEIRPFTVGQDASVVYRADEEAFQDQRGHTPRTFEQWKQRLAQGEEVADPALWLIAWDADEIAGAALGEIIENVGWIHHLFVRRPWRRRGLGAALTRSAAGAFHQRGVGAVRLNVDEQSLTNAHELYRRVGFYVVGAYSNYEKIVPLA